MEPAWTKPIAYLESILLYHFFEAVELFQEIVDLTLKDPFIDKSLNVYKGSAEQLTVKKTQNTCIKLTTFRIITCSNISFLLCAQSAPCQKLDQYFCLIVSCPKSLAAKWGNEVGLNMSLTVKQPYFQAKMVNQMGVCMTRLENIVLQPVHRWKHDSSELKNKGNQLYGAREFYKALIFYEYAMIYFQYGIGKSEESHKNQKNSRAILYSNAAACLFELKLFDQTIRYANLSIQIDSSYAKSYFRKINALLEKKQFHQIPSLLIQYGERVDAQKLKLLNKKFTLYVCNTLGIYNWSEMLKTSAEQADYAYTDYISDKIQLRKLQQCQFYYAKQDIYPYQMLIFCKPFMYVKNEKDLNLQKFTTEYSKVAVLQKNYLYNPEQLNIKKSPQMSFRQLKKMQLLGSLYPSYQLIKYKQGQIKGYGIWVCLSNILHNCSPNCSYANIKSALCVSSCKFIPKDSIIVIDFGCYRPVTNRKAFLKERLMINCTCDFCSWLQWPQNIDSLEQVIENTKDPKKILLIKNVTWSLIRDQKNFYKNYGDQVLYKSVFDKYMGLLLKQTHWVDLLRLLQFLKLESHWFLFTVASNRFAKMLKVDEAQCPSLINDVL